jgi:hypothetical protein
MASHKLQLYVTEEQYRYLKRCAGDRRSMAEVVRQLIDAAGRPADPSSDSFLRYVLQDKAPSGEPYSAEEAKRELYRRPR